MKIIANINPARNKVNCGKCDRLKSTISRPINFIAENMAV